MENLPAAPTVSPRSRLVASVLAIFTGIFGGHRFYVGKIGSGIGMLCTIGGFGVWYLIDNIMILAGEFRDRQGRRLLRWTVDETGDLIPPPGSPAGARPPQQLLEDMEAMRHDMYELQERVDFMERMLAQVKEQRRVGSKE